ETAAAEAGRIHGVGHEVGGDLVGQLDHRVHAVGLHVHRLGEVADGGVAVGDRHDRVLAVVGVADAGREAQLVGEVIDPVGVEGVVGGPLLVVEVVVVDAGVAQLASGQGPQDRIGGKRRQVRRDR